jgi:hypothetical protein
VVLEDKKTENTLAKHFFDVVCLSMISLMFDTAGDLRQREGS